MTITKNFLSHWAFKNIVIKIVIQHSEFKVEVTSYWIPHIFVVKSLDLQFKILAESTYGPSIVEYENSLSCNFHLSSRYPEALKILENFILEKFYKIQV